MAEEIEYNNGGTAVPFALRKPRKRSELLFRPSRHPKERGDGA